MASTNVVQQQQQSAPAAQEQAWYKKGALPLGSCIAGIPIYLHWTFFALLGIMLVSSLFSHATDVAYWVMILLLYGPILLVTIIIVRFTCFFYVPLLSGRIFRLLTLPTLPYSSFSMNLDML